MRPAIVAVVCLAVAGCAPSLEPVVIQDAGKVVPSSSGEPAKPTPAEQAVADGFVPLGKKDGVTLFKRDAERGLEFAVEGELPASPERVRRVLIDYPAHTKWQERLAEDGVVSGPEMEVGNVQDASNHRRTRLYSDRDGRRAVD